jgi:hypothetical protein
MAIPCAGRLTVSSLVYLWNKNQAPGVTQGYFTEDDLLAFRERAASCE